jgi:hypothetical protein
MPPSIFRSWSAGSSMIWVHDPRYVRLRNPDHGQARPSFCDPGLKPAYLVGLGPGSWNRRGRPWRQKDIADIEILRGLASGKRTDGHIGAA